MQDYEYKDEGGRFLCRLHHRMRCDECHYVSELREQNKRYREALLDVRETLNTSLSLSAEVYESLEIIDKAFEVEE